MRPRHVYGGGFLKAVKKQEMTITKTIDFAIIDGKISIKDEDIDNDGFSVDAVFYAHTEMQYEEGRRFVGIAHPGVQFYASDYTDYEVEAIKLWLQGNEHNLEMEFVKMDENYTGSKLKTI